MARGPKAPPHDPLQPMRRFARPSRQGREQDLALCRFLRGASGSSARTYRCGRTMTGDGPDGAPASPEECTDERPCFEPAVVEGKA